VKVLDQEDRKISRKYYFNIYRVTEKVFLVSDVAWEDVITDTEKMPEVLEKRSGCE